MIASKKNLKIWIEKSLVLYAGEISHYFYTPSAYVVIVVFLLICGYFFAAPLFINNQATIVTFSGIAPLLFTFFVPALTMRLFAEEYKTRTIEVLLTNPVTAPQIIIAKLASAMTVILVTLLLTFAYPVSISFLGDIDMSAVWCSYLGLFLTAKVFASIGIFASAITKNQITAFITSFMFCFALYFIGKVAAFVPAWLTPITNFAGIDIHLDNLSRGIIDTRDILYYLSFSGFFIFLVYIKLRISREN